MKVLIRWSPPAAVMAAIFFFSSRSGDDLSTVMPLFQLLFPQMSSFDWGHFVAYFILSLSFLWALDGARPRVAAKGVAVLLCLLYGITDEYHQTFVAGRMSDWQDLRNDGIGALIAVVVVSLPGVRRLYAKLPHAKKY